MDDGKAPVPFLGIAQEDTRIWLASSLGEACGGDWAVNTQTFAHLPGSLDVLLKPALGEPVQCVYACVSAFCSHVPCLVCLLRFPAFR